MSRLLLAVVVTLLAAAGVTQTDAACRLRGLTPPPPPPPELARDGDLVIGGIFSFRTAQDYVEDTFQTLPELRKCKNFNFREFKFAQTAIFAINEINENAALLPGVTLGYRIYDACGTMDILRAAMALLSGVRQEVSGVRQEVDVDGGKNCTKPDTVQAIIGHSGSRPTIAFAQVVGRFQVSVISHFATCACLSDRKEFPTFFRTIPSDYFQSRALAKLVKHFGWTWIGAVAVDNEYGLNGVAAFARAAAENGVCVEYSEAFSSSDPPERLRRIVEVVRRATSRVLVAFMSHREVKLLAAALAAHNVTGLQWVGSDAWITDHSLSDGEGRGVLTGALGFAVPHAKIPGLERHLRRLRPSQFPDSRFLRDFWEDVFDCELNATAAATAVVRGRRKPCTGEESLQEVESPFTDVSELRFANNVYKSVYAVAHAMHDLLAREDGAVDRAVDRVAPWQVLRYLSAVNFTTAEGERVYFDANGDSPARYELVNLQTGGAAGRLDGVTVGVYDAALPEDRHFVMNGVPLVWGGGGGSEEVPASVCSESCRPGTRKVLTKGRPVCCYDCTSCPDGEISNTTDSVSCLKCPPSFWSDPARTSCVPKLVEFLSLDELLGTLLAAAALLGAFLTLTTALVFYVHKDTPVVRANNSELSFLLLLALTLCFLCSLTFLGAPSRWSCMLRHTAFGVTFVLCISCVLGKTVVVLMAFRARLPGSAVMKWLGPAQQRLSVAAFTLVQVGICSVWLAVRPPFPVRNLSTYKDRIILECDLGSAVGFWAVLGYVGLLAVFCFALATLARKLPDNFNEAKFITFSMLIFCAVWIAFIPAYVSSPGKFTVAVEIFAILASSYGMLICIFGPKLYVILLKPERNTRRHVMGKTSEIRY